MNKVMVNLHPGATIWCRDGPRGKKIKFGCVEARHSVDGDLSFGYPYGKSRKEWWNFVVVHYSRYPYTDKFWETMKE